MISRALYDVLSALPKGTPMAYVFTRADGSPWEPHSVGRAFRMARPRPELSVHSIRHTAASWLAIAGVPLRTIAAILGHSQLAMTFRYAHLSPEAVSDAVDVIPEMEKGGVGTPRRHPDAGKTLAAEGLLPS